MIHGLALCNKIQMLRVNLETSNGIGLTPQFRVTWNIGRTAICRVLISQCPAEGCTEERTTISCTIMIVTTTMQRYVNGD